MASSAVPASPEARQPLPISEDIRDTAYDLADQFSDWYGCDSTKREQLTAAFANAIAQEREDCAFAAETHSGFGEPATIAAVANIIRRRGIDEAPSEIAHLTQGRYLELLQAEEIFDGVQEIFDGVQEVYGEDSSNSDGPF